MVVWHQRNSGKTLKENPTVSPVAVDRMFRDAVEMVERLSAEYHQPSIYVLGHSWGGYLALRLAGLFPDRVRACFAMSPMIDQEESERMTLDSLQQWANRNRSDAISELKEIRIPFHSYRSLNLHRKWMAVMAGNSPPDEKFVREWSGQWLETFVEASRTDISKVHPEMKCPVFFLIGQKDLQTHFRLAEDYFRTLRASHKELIWFEKSGHAPHRTESAKFRETIFRLTGN